MMKPLIIKKTEETPAIIFLPNKKTFQIVATSWPENAKEFYEPVYAWIQQYFSNSPLEKSVFQFRLTYMNTSSSKQIARIVALLKEFSKSYDVEIQWIYEKGDIDMMVEGKRFAQILNLDIKLIEK